MCSLPRHSARRTRQAVARIALALSVAAAAALLASQPQPAASEHAGGGGETFFVSTKGNDHWSGRLPAPNHGGTDGPFATPARAQEAVRRALRLGTAKPIHVMVRGGKYFLPQTLVLDERDSGGKGGPVTWSAYPGECPIFSGGAKVVHWKPFEKKILQANLAQIGRDVRPRDLFFNGVRQIRARTPNFDPDHPLHGGWAFMQGPAGPDAFRYPKGLFQRPLRKPSQAEVRFFVGPNGGVGSQVLSITSVDYGRRLIHTDYRGGGHPLVGFNGNCRFVIENALEELDQPGEWCVDLEAGKLYFWPPSDLDGVPEVVVPILSTILRFSHATWITVSAITFTETLVGSGYGDALRCDDSQHIGILRNRFLGTGSRGVTLFGKDKPCSDVLIQGNEIAYAGGSGIYVGGSARDCQVLANDVHHCAVHDKYAAGIEFPFYGATAAEVGPDGYTDRILIAHNHLHDLPRDGIQLGANAYGRNVVEYNRIERTALETVDAGALRCHRVVSHLQGVKGLAEMAGHVFRYNRVADTLGCGVLNGKIVTPYPWPTFGIYLDEGSSHCAVYGNIVLRSGVGAIINPGEFNTIENNVFAGNSVGIYFQAVAPFQERKPPMGGNRFLRNVVYLTRREDVGYSLRNWTKRTVQESDFNVFWNAAGAVVLETQAGADTPLTKRSLADWQQVGYDRHSQVVDPQFVGPSEDDYRLAQTSPARALGFVPVDAAAIGIRHGWKTK